MSGYLLRPNPEPDDQDYGSYIEFTQQKALEASERIMHEPTPHAEDDVQLVAGYLFAVLSQPRWKSEWRTGAEWVRVGGDPE